MPTAALEEMEEGADVALFERGYVERLKARQVKSVWIGFACAIGMIAILSIVGGDSSGGGGGLGEAIREAAESTRIITADEFARLQDGMTYAQAVQIVGSRGRREQPDIAGRDHDDHVFRGPNDDFSNANAMFQDGRLVSKAQFGL